MTQEPVKWSLLPIGEAVDGGPKLRYATLPNCFGCGRFTGRDAIYYDRWSYAYGCIDETLIYCPTCAEREGVRSTRRR